MGFWKKFFGGSDEITDPEFKKILKQQDDHINAMCRQMNQLSTRPRNVSSTRSTVHAREEVKVRLSKLPISQEYASKSNKDSDSDLIWNGQMSVDEAVEFILQRATLAGWSMEDSANKKSLRATYMVGGWLRYCDIWRVSETEYAGAHNYYQEIG